VLIDRGGRVVGLVRGERDWQGEAARHLVSRLLAEGTSSVVAATILAAPDAWEGKELTLRGRVLKMSRAVFPNGRPYYTVLVGEEGSALTVFSWSRPSVGPGDLVEAVGVFHVWRYNVHYMLASTRITRLDKTR
jgi:hypothetical protein